MAMKHFIIFSLFFVFSEIAYSQPIQADFSVLTQACRLQNLYLENQSVNGIGYEWDFCQGDLSLTPTSSVVGSIGLGVPEDIEIVFDGANWFGFAVSRSNNAIVRLDFGNDLDSTPTIVNLGNISSMLNGPTGIRIIKATGFWYGFVYNSNGNLITRIDFGSSLSNSTLTAQVIISGAGAPDGGIDLVNYEGKWFILFAGRNSMTSVAYAGVARLTDINSIPGTSDIQSHIVSGVDYIAGCKLLQQDGSWFGYLVTNNGPKTIQRISFGNDIFNVSPSIQDITMPIVASYTPYGLDGGFDAGKYCIFISTLSGDLLKIDLGNDLSLSPSSGISLGDLGILSNTLKVKLIHYQSAWFAFTFNYSSSQIYKIKYPNGSCGISPAFSTDIDPVIDYSIAGQKNIGLRAYGSGGAYSEKTKIVDILIDQSSDIAFTIQNICANNPTDFTSQNTSGDIVSYSWTFGDAIASSAVNPSHTYSTNGEFEIQLEVTSVNSCKNNIFKTLKIYNAPNASFNVPAGPICTNNEFTFTGPADTFDGNLSYQWHVNGDLKGDEEILAYTFPAEGDYNVTLTTSIPGCSDQAVQVINGVQSGPVIGFTHDLQCEDVNISFTNTSSGSISGYSWNLGNGVNTSAANPVTTYPTDAIYNVTLSATGTNGCVSTVSQPIAIYPNPSVDFTITAPVLHCSETPIQFEDRTIQPAQGTLASWNWNFADTGTGNTSGLQNPQHTYKNAGDYNVSLDVTTSFGCTTTKQKSVHIDQSPSSAFTNTLACNNLPANFASTGTAVKLWNWKIGDRDYTTKSPTHTFRAAGDYDASLQVVGTNNCTTTTLKKITVPVPLDVDFSVTKNCVDENAVLTDITTGVDAVASREWKIEQTTLNGNPANYSFKTTGDKSVVLNVTAQSGCQYSKTKSVAIVPRPQANFSPSTEIGSPPITIDFVNRSSNATSYQWTLPGEAASSETSLSYDFTALGEYTVELVAANQQGCADKISKTITIGTPVPDVSIMAITTQEDNGFVNVVITLENTGNTVVKNLPIDIDLSGNASFREVIKDQILPRARYNFDLGYGIRKTDDLQFLCAQAKLPDDVNASGDRSCAQLQDNLYLFNAYPNPAKDQLSIEWVSNEEQAVNIYLVNSIGSRILHYSVNSTKGFNHQSLDLAFLRQGIYFLIIEGAGAKLTQRIAIAQ